MKDFRNNKGITLVVLIITIVVLLLLVVITIRSADGEGIINHAENASSNYTALQEEEILKTSVLMAQTIKRKWNFYCKTKKYFNEKY